MSYATKIMASHDSPNVVGGSPLAQVTWLTGHAITQAMSRDQANVLSSFT